MNATLRNRNRDPEIPGTFQGLSQRRVRLGAQELVGILYILEIICIVVCCLVKLWICHWEAARGWDTNPFSGEGEPVGFAVEQRCERKKSLGLGGKC